MLFPPLTLVGSLHLGQSLGGAIHLFRRMPGRNYETDALPVPMVGTMENCSNAKLEQAFVQADGIRQRRRHKGLHREETSSEPEASLSRAMAETPH
jgi:hypothetical protein